MLKQVFLKGQGLLSFDKNENGEDLSVNSTGDPIRLYQTEVPLILRFVSLRTFRTVSVSEPGKKSHEACIPTEVNIQVTDPLYSSV